MKPLSFKERLEYVPPNCPKCDGPGSVVAWEVHRSGFNDSYWYPTAFDCKNKCWERE